MSTAMTPAMKPLTRSSLATDLAEACALEPPAAARTVEAIIAGLMAALSQPALRHFAALLGEPVPALVDAGLLVHRDDLVAFVAGRSGSPPTAALEAILVLASAVASAWSEEDARVIALALAPSLRALFVVRPAADPVQRAPADAADANAAAERNDTLASGAPGSRHPLSSSAPWRAR